ncbi:MAG: hypothetical protein QW292_14180, partial [Candidatus Parvarchaeota archaeon]
MKTEMTHEKSAGHSPMSPGSCSVLSFLLLEKHDGVIHIWKSKAKSIYTAMEYICEVLKMPEED